MEIADGIQIEVLDQSQIGEARRRITMIAAEHGLSQKIVDRLALIASELATNIVKYSVDGTMLVQAITDGSALGLEIFSMDKGPGMANVSECLRDGFSTTGTMGTGLGAVLRLSDSLDITSSLDKGTILRSVVWSEKPSHGGDIGGMTVPLKGERLSGDKWHVCHTDDGVYCLLVDGLGHGFEASEAAKIAVDRFKGNQTLPPAVMIQTIHKSLRGTRGAVGAVAKINFKENSLAYCGLGNISGILVHGAERKHLTSLNGTLGYESRKILEFKHPWTESSVLIMHSDGLSSKVWDEASNMDLANTHSSLIAASLYFRQTKRTDDATVMVVKQVKGNS